MQSFNFTVSKNVEMGTIEIFILLVMKIKEYSFYTFMKVL